MFKPSSLVAETSSHSLPLNSKDNDDAPVWQESHLLICCRHFGDRTRSGFPSAVLTVAKLSAGRKPRSHCQPRRPHSEPLHAHTDTASPRKSAPERAQGAGAARPSGSTCRQVTRDASGLQARGGGVRFLGACAHCRPALPRP